MTAIILLILCFFSLFSKHSNDGDCSSKTFFKSIMPFGEASCERISLYPLVKEYSAAYIHHLFKSHEPLGGMLATIHNLYFMADYMNKIRENILKDKI